ncbi:hypothetical protein RCH15_003706 [Arthrobacter sp. MP_M4]|nr:hypothetical protein [Arthrobacter sp. MP_M4]
MTARNFHGGHGRVRAYGYYRKTGRRVSIE